jgi:acetoin utilization deacetylase AcuC-like enzyme
LFNNAAVAARQAQAVHGVERVLIVDVDVHHGNGTQDIFYEDASVLFVSTHMYMDFFYPGTGAAGETGAGAGRGYTLNVPFPPVVGNLGYQRAMAEVIRPKATAFAPGLVLVSIGFDAHWQDPLASADLTLTGYVQVVRDLMAIAADLCQGRILFILEGGYVLEALSFGVLNTLYALLGRDQIEDPLGPSPRREQDVSRLLAQLKQLHQL